MHHATNVGRSLGIGLGVNAKDRAAIRVQGDCGNSHERWWAGIDPFDRCVEGGMKYQAERATLVVVMHNIPL